MSIINITGTIAKNAEVSGVMGATAITGTLARNVSIYANIFLRELVTYCPEAVKLLNAMNIAPTKALMDLIDITIMDLKAAGIWAITDKFHRWDLHTGQASLLDWKNPAHHAVAGAGTPLFTPKYGVQTKGLEEPLEGNRNWIDLNFNPLADCQAGSLNSIGYSLDDLVGTAVTSFNFGAKNTANNSWLMFRTKESDGVNRPWMYANSILQRVYNNAGGIKLFYCERNSSTTIRLFQTNALFQQTVSPSVAMINQRLVLGGYREYNGGVNRYGISSSIFWLGASMSDVQRIAWWNIMNYWKANLPQTF